ncbi:hypothetical protein JCM18899A_08060 [Nocardioides sp. AN3]
MARDATSAASLLTLAQAAWASGDGPAAMSSFERAAAAAQAEEDRAVQAGALLGLARGQRYNLTPGLLPARLHALYETTDESALRAQLASALARCWSYANEPRRARPFAVEALHLADRLDDPAVLTDALDAGLTSHWGPDDLSLRRDWALRLGDVAVHLTDLDAQLQAHLWSLTVAWEVLDLTRMHRAVHALELLAADHPRAEFFAASRRLTLEILRGRLEVAPLLIQRAAAAARATVIPDADEVGHSMRAYTAFFAGDPQVCAEEAPEFEGYAVEFGVATVRAEAATIWLGAGRLDKVAEMIRVFTPDVLDALPRDSDWLLVHQCVLEGALATGDREITEAVVSRLAPYAGRSVVNAGAVMWHGVTDDTLARGHALLGHDEAAARHRAAALATYERVGAVWWRDRLREQLPAEPEMPSDRVVVHLHQQPGGLWLVGREGATFVLPRMRGLVHLQALLATPDTDTTAASLVGPVIVEQPGLELLDAESRRALTARLSVLDDRLAELSEDDDRADVRTGLEEERRMIAAYLADGTGLAHRSRATGSNAERARIAVRKAIVAAMARIAETDPWLGRHLHDRVTTGHRCRYSSDPDRPVHWILDGQ